MYSPCVAIVLHSVVDILDEDDEGERITVRGDDELRAMVSFVSYILKYKFLSQLISSFPMLA